MNHSIIEKSGMYKKMLIFFANPLNSVIWSTFTRLVNEITNFNNLYATLSTYLQQHSGDISGVTDTKNKNFTAMVSVVVSKAQKAYVWAIDINNDVLAKTFDIQKSDFKGVTEAEAFVHIKNVRDLLAANIAAMASVQLVAADVTLMNTAITAYQNTIGTPAAAQAHKTEGTHGADSMIAPMDISLGLIDNLIEGTYAETHPDMVDEYFLNRALDKMPVHHSGVHLHATNAATGEDEPGVLLEVAGKSSITDIEGVADVIKVKSQTCNITISKPTFVTQTLKITITRGKVTVVEVKMVKGS